MHLLSISSAQKYYGIERYSPPKSVNVTQRKRAMEKIFKKIYRYHWQIRMVPVLYKMNKDTSTSIK
jgi:hypothetical protein